MCIYTVVVIVKTLSVLGHTIVCLSIEHGFKIWLLISATLFIFYLVSFDLDSLLILQQFQNNQLKYTVVVGSVVLLQPHHRTNHNDVF